MHSDTKNISGSFELIPAKTGADALAFRLPDGTLRFVHSAYEPEKEAEKWVDRCRLEGTESCIILGYGLGYHIRALRARHPGVRFIVFDAFDGNMLRASDINDADAVSLWRNPDGERITEETEKLLSDFSGGGLRVLFYMPAVKLNEALYNGMLTLIHKLIDKEASACANEGRDITRAAALFCAAAAIAPTDWRCLYYLGLMQAELGDYDSALISIGFAVRMCSDIGRKAAMAFTLARFNECLRAGEKDFLIDLYSGFIRDFEGTNPAQLAAKRLEIIKKAPEYGDKRAVFCMSTGRCGTLFLYELAQSNLDGWDIGHEKHPALFSPPGKAAVASGMLEKKRFFDESDRGLFETNHQFIKHYSNESLSMFGNALRVFHLVRDPVEVAYSFAMRCSAPGRCAPWKGRDGSPYLSRFHLNPLRVHERRFMKHWTPEWTMFESNLWECFEVHARAFDFSDSLEPGQTFMLPFHCLNDEKRMKEFFSWVKGDSTSAVHGTDTADRHTNVVPTKVDDEVLGVYSKWLSSLPVRDLAVVRRVLERMHAAGALAGNAPSLAGLRMLEPAAV